MRRGAFEYFTRTVEGRSTASTVAVASRAARRSPIRSRRPAPRPARPSCSTRTRSPTVTTTSRSATSSVEPRPDPRGVQRRHQRRRALRAALPRPRRPAPTSTTSCPTSTTASRGRTTVRTSSTRVPTTRCARGRCGATASALPPATTCSCSRRTTTASTSASVAPAAVASSRSRPRRRSRARSGWSTPTRPTPTPVIVEPRVQGHEYHVEHHAGPAGDRLFVLTNADGAENFTLGGDGGRHARSRATGRPCSRTATTPASTTSTPSPTSSWCPSAPTPSSGCASSPWATTAPSRRPRARDAGTRVLGVARRQPRVRHHHRALPVHVVGLARRRRSTTTPATRARDAGQAPAGARGYDPDRYESRRVWATAPDGTQVPISIVYRRDRRGRRPEPDAPLRLRLVRGVDRPDASPRRAVSLLDRGVVFAIAHIRGGGELGRGGTTTASCCTRRTRSPTSSPAPSTWSREGWTVTRSPRDRGAAAPAAC